MFVERSGLVCVGISDEVRLAVGVATPLVAASNPASISEQFELGAGMYGAIGQVVAVAAALVAKLKSEPLACGHGLFPRVVDDVDRRAVGRQGLGARAVDHGELLLTRLRERNNHRTRSERKKPNTGGRLLVEVDVSGAAEHIGKVAVNFGLRVVLRIEATLIEPLFEGYGSLAGRA